MGVINTKYTAGDVKIDELPFFSGTIPEPNKTITREHITDITIEHKKKEERKLERDHRLHLRGLIYNISNSADNLVYIGSTVGTIKDRFTKHKRDARNGSTWALHLHMRTHGSELFSITEIDAVELVTIDDLHVLESKYMSIHKSVFNGLNSNYASRMCYHGLLLKKCKDCYVDMTCMHYVNRRLCFDCNCIEQTLRVCSHYKLRECCHLCNKCKCCNAISTKEHVLTTEHVQCKIRADVLEALRDNIREQKHLQFTLYKRVGFSHEQFKILTMRRQKRLGRITLQKLNRKQVNLITSAWDVYLELINQADN